MAGALSFYRNMLYHIEWLSNETESLLRSTRNAGRPIEVHNIMDDVKENTDHHLATSIWGPTKEFNMPKATMRATIKEHLGGKWQQDAALAIL